jgi:outer membrane protein assembly factor BamB
MLKDSPIKNNANLWKKIILIAGIFSFIICILLIANYIQIKKADPINMKVINSLVDRLNQTPNDSILREQIRTLDLLSRKAYFTNQWQIRMGGYLLLFGIAVMLIAYQFISFGRKTNPDVPTGDIESAILSQKTARKWIAVSGISLSVVALFFAFLSHNELNSKFKPSTQPIVKNDLTDTVKQAKLNEEDKTIQDTVKSKVANVGNEIAKNQTAGDEPKTAKTNAAESKDNDPTFRGPGGYGIVPQKNIPISWDGKTGKNIAWKTEIPLPGYNSPVVWGGKIFLAGANATKREIYCIAGGSGKILWTTPVEKLSGSSAQAPTVSEGTGYSAPTAATDGKGVYAIFANGDIVALDMDGKKMWAKSLGVPQNHYGHSSSLMIYKDKVIVQFDQKGGSKLMALSTQTGQTVWSTNRSVKVSWSSPIVAFTGKRTEIILAAEPFVASYNPATGEELWKLDCISGEVGPSPAYANGMVFSVNDYSKLAAIQLGDQPKLLWENTDYLSDVPSPVATDKYLFLSTSYGTVVCYDTQTGKKYWDKELNNSVYASPIIAEGKVYLLDRTGIMHIFKADQTYVSLGEPKLGEKSDCTPAFSNGRIYIRGEKNLYCIGK